MALDTEIYEGFKNAFHGRCFQLLVDAYQTSVTVKAVQLDWNENDISSELHECMKKNPLRVKWKISTNVEAHLPDDRAKIKGFSATFPRIDFRLTSFISEYEYDYFFEAKNLKVSDSALKRRYIDTGIDNFVSGKYSTGCIIGYILEGATADTVTGINSLLTKDHRDSESLTVKPHSLHTDYYESEHSTIGTLKHFMLNFTTT
ncbi:hypothetical protein [Flavobacterium coralii]|uniref:hypothetical protein n=1 Tax=Flavobacterium coralii TaxID=2838017 RepID=UPI000C3B1A7F|nr:hypothetical protein [Flavobacterium sp.]|tara:strand:+ start:41019 stop:41627 length:609 start_codon:yes stop_codon:yes gene_type:complete